MTSQLSPWAKRFLNLSDPDFITERCRVDARPLHDLSALPVQTAADLLEAEFKRVFIPTAACVKLLAMLMERAMSYATTRYPNERHFLAQCYGQCADQIESAPLCISGLAGVGKSQVRNAFFRLLPQDDVVKVTAHGEFPLSAARLVVVQSRKSILEVYRSLARPGVAEKSLRGETAWLKECQLWLYQCGVCTVGLDELQFLTQSERANTLVTQFLMAMTYLGPPVFFTFNYSLGHRLMQRNQEERQRLLTRINLLHPDDCESESWKSIIREYQKVAPELFAFDFLTEARLLWSLAAGINRCLAQLLVLAFRQVRRSSARAVLVSDLLAAYHSVEFCTQRQDVEILFTNGLNGVKGRSDLSCPFPVSSVEAEKYANALQTTRREEVAQAVVKAVMTQDESRGAKAIEAAAAPKAVNSKGGKAHKVKAGASTTLEHLKRAALQFRKDLP